MLDAQRSQDDVETEFHVLSSSLRPQTKLQSPQIEIWNTI